jgi:hypothetical protein
MTLIPRVLSASAILCLAGATGKPTPLRAATSSVPSVGIGVMYQLRAYPPPAVPTEANVSGYHVPRDGGGGRFRFEPSSCAPDNEGTVIAPVPTPACGRWIRIDPGNPTVKWFGARGDGQTPDTDAIQAAVDAHPPGGTLVFPAGVYRIETDKAVRLKDDMRLDLVGATLVGANVEGARCRIFEIQGRRNIVIRGGTLVGARWGSPEWGVGILASDAQDLTIENTWFRDFYHDGILLTGNRGCERVAVRGVVAVNNRRTGLAIVHASDVTVEASTFSGTRGQSPEAGVNCEPNEGEEVRNVRFSGLWIASNAGVGLYAHRGAGAAVSDVSVLGSLVERNGSGIVVSGVNGASIADNRVVDHSGQGRSGIILGDGTTEAVVARNWLQGNFRGVLSSGASGVEIRENTVVGTGPAPTAAEAVGRDGIACLGGNQTLAEACIVADNTIRRPGANGITTRQVTHVQLLDNVMEDAGHRSIHLRATGISEVRGNRISGSGQEPPPGRYDAIELEELSYLNKVIANEIHASPGMRHPIGVAPDCKGNWILSNTVLP